MIKPGTMVKYFPKPIKSALGNFMVDHTVMDEEFVKMEKLRGMLNAWRGAHMETYDLEPATYVKLVGKGHGIMMSDTPMEIRTNREFMNEAHGDVIIAGLGLGIVLLSIQDNKDISSITVVELYAELIDLIAPRIPLNKKVKIVNADIFKWSPPKGAKYDTIYFDIWDEIGGDNYPATKELHKRFRKYLNKEGGLHWWMNSWRRDDFKRKYFENRADEKERWRFEGNKRSYADMKTELEEEKITMEEK